MTPALLSLLAAGLIDPMSAITLDRASQQPASRYESPYMSMLIKSNDTSQTRKHIDSINGIVYRERANILLASVPHEHLEQLAEDQCIIRIASCPDMQVEMVAARPFGRVDIVQNGIANGLPENYDGTGVICGFSDIGFDPNHVAFEGRVKMISDLDGAFGVARRVDTPEEIANWTTDTDGETHATHVCNIMAGGYKGNGYYGVAPGADIVGTTSLLTDVGILGGIEDIIEYAKEEDKPVVINLSVSSFLGPHDGTDLFDQYLSDCAKDAIICVAAGNNGGHNCSARHVFSSDTEEASVRVLDKPNIVGFQVAGMTDIWSDDDREFSVRIRVWDESTHEYVFTSDAVGEGGLKSLYISDSKYPEWGKYFDGDISLAASLEAENNRYNVAVSYNTKTTAMSTRGKWARYFTVLTATSADGAAIEFYTDGNTSEFKTVTATPGAIYPDNKQTINDMAVSRGIISVGSTTTCNSVTLLNNTTDTWDLALNLRSDFSSLGTFEGESLPVIYAPGAYIVSAVSTPYLNAGHNLDLAASAPGKDGRTDYWYPECGTSMATPYVCGVIALWLQADPTLTTADVKQIMVETARTLNDGYPEIDAQAGMNKVLQNLAVTDLPGVEDNADDGAYYNLQGIRVDNPHGGVFINNGRKVFIK